MSGSADVRVELGLCLLQMRQERLAIGDVNVFKIGIAQLVHGRQR